MNNRKFSLLTLAALLMCGSAFGQGAGADLFAAPRYTLLTAYNGYVTNAGASLTVSNGPVDLKGYDGVGSIIFSCTNNTGAGSLMYARVETSTDATNWTLMNPVCAVSTLTPYNITNFFYPSSQAQATNYWLLPGTVSNYLGTAAAPLGYAGQWINPTPFSSYGVLCTNVAGGTFVMGFSLQDAPRYIHVVATTTGTQASWFMNAVLVGRRGNNLVFY